MEKRIIESFKKYMEGEVDELDLLVNFCDDEENCVHVMERRDNGRVWECEITASGKVIEAFELK